MINPDTVIDHFNVDIPAAIKIDVDGNELSVIRGLLSILTSDCVKSVLVEVRSDSKSEIDRLLVETGFTEVEPKTLSSGESYDASYRKLLTPQNDVFHGNQVTDAG